MNSKLKLLVYLDNGAYMPDKAHSTDANIRSSKELAGQGIGGEKP